MAKMYDLIKIKDKYPVSIENKMEYLLFGKTASEKPKVVKTSINQFTFNKQINPQAKTFLPLFGVSIHEMFKINKIP